MKEQSYIIIDFLDINTDNITFNKPKKHNYGSYVNIRYNGKQMYVRYDARVCLFGFNIEGNSTSISLLKDYENDPYYKKACELDEFFIGKCIEKSVMWSLGGSKSKKVDRASIAGYDDKGDKGKWKRILKYAYKVDKQTKERIYLEYPPHLDFGINLSKTKFYDNVGDRIQDVDTDNIDVVLPKWSSIGILALWSNLSLGTYGASLKPKAQQIRVFICEDINGECLLNEDEDEDEDALGDMLVI